MPHAGVTQLVEFLPYPLQKNVFEKKEYLFMVKRQKELTISASSFKKRETRLELATACLEAKFCNECFLSAGKTATLAVTVPFFLSCKAGGR